jgi:hypothetical protein
MVWGQHGGVQNVVMSYVKKTSKAWWSTPIIPDAWEIELGGSWSKAGPRQKCKTWSELWMKERRGKKMTQVVD